MRSQYNGQIKKVKRAKNDVQNTTLKTKDQETRKPGVNSCVVVGQEVPAPHVVPVTLILLQTYASHSYLIMLVILYTKLKKSIIRYICRAPLYRQDMNKKGMHPLTKN
jgi:hypothetical protein